MEENNIEELDLSQTPRVLSKSSLSKNFGTGHKHGLSPKLLCPKKQRIRARESLVGAFVIEEVDLSEMSAGKAHKGRIWRQSEVEVFDLTAGD
jgi:hypothetical protein